MQHNNYMNQYSDYQNQPRVLNITRYKTKQDT